MGSAIAQQVALASPGRVSTMVLIGAFASGVDSPFFNDFLLAQTLEGRSKRS